MHICMDWRSVKFDWNRARAFLVTAEEGSLSAAARALAMTQPTLGRQVLALEEELGVVLFERSGRGLVLTPSGQDLLDHVRAMGDAANRISLRASGQSQEIEGAISITAGEMHSAHLLPPIVEKLRREAPGIEVDIVASNNAKDLRRREADIALRGFRPTQPELIARKVREETARLYATPDYLDSIGKPRNAEELALGDFIGFDTTSMYRDVLAKAGLDVGAERFGVLSSNHLVHWQLVCQGVGIGTAPECIGDKEPRVVRALEDFVVSVFPVWLTTHREVNTSRRVRFVFDFLAAELAAA